VPIYDYICSSCGHRVEVLHGVHDERPRTCERCGGQMRKAFAPPTIMFKGTGWAKKERRSARGTSQPATGDEASPADGDRSSARSGAEEASTGSGDSARSNGDLAARGSSSGGGSESG